jgi:hypothetical protein
MFKKLRIKEHEDSWIGMEECIGNLHLSVGNAKTNTQGIVNTPIRLILEKTEVKQLIKNLVDVLGKM